MKGILEKLALKSLQENKLQLWLTVLIEFDGANTPKILKSFTRPAKESTVKQLKTPKKKAVKIEQGYTSIKQGDDLF
jgi:hypothetical protein